MLIIVKDFFCCNLILTSGKVFWKITLLAEFKIHFSHSISVGKVQKVYNPANVYQDDPFWWQSPLVVEYLCVGRVQKVYTAQPGNVYQDDPYWWQSALDAESLCGQSLESV